MRLNAVSTDWIFVQGTESEPMKISDLVVMDLYHRVLSGENIHESAYARDLRRAFTEGQPQFECETLSEIEQRVEKIATRMSQKSDCLEFRFPVSLHKDGRFYLKDGHHRCARIVFENPEAKINLEIVEVHPEWRKLISDLDSLYPHLSGTPLYQPIEHPYFDLHKADRSTFRQTLIADYLTTENTSGGEALVVGSCTGLTARTLSRLGFNATGIEINETLVDIARRLSALPDFPKAHFELNGGHTHPENHTVLKLKSRKWDVVTILSVMHRFFSDHPNESYLRPHRKASEEVIREAFLNSRYFFYESGSPEDLSLLPSAVPLDREGHQKWLQSISGCAHIEWLGSGYDGRNLYVLKN